MISEDVQEDPVLAALNDMRAWDVDQRRARRLRARCRRALATQNRGATAESAAADSARWTHIAAPALLVVWCAIYVIEIVRYAAAIYGM
jgi:hypothetical protein